MLLATCGGLFGLLVDVDVVVDIGIGRFGALVFASDDDDDDDDNEPTAFDLDVDDGDDCSRLPTAGCFGG